jgi:hypothetical protein
MRVAAGRPLAEPGGISAPLAVAAVLAGLFSAALGGCSGSGADGEDGTPCAVGTLAACTCSGETGVRLCGPGSVWTGCNCSEDATFDIPGMEDIVVGPSPTPGAPAWANPASGAAPLVSKSYRLQVVVGPAAPAGAGQSKNYRLQLSPAAAR